MKKTILILSVFIGLSACKKEVPEPKKCECDCIHPDTLKKWLDARKIMI